MTERRDPLMDAMDGLGEAPLPGELQDAELAKQVLAYAEHGMLEAPDLLAEADEAPAPSGGARLRLGVLAAVGMSAAAVLVSAWAPVTEFLRTDGGPASSSAQVVSEDERARTEGRARVVEARARRVAAPSPAPPELPEQEAQVDPPSQLSPEPAEEDGRLDPPAPEPREGPAPKGPSLSPDDLLDRAQRALRAGDERRALIAYEHLTRRYPRTAAGRSALVTLGRMRLERGQSSRALAAFDRYLRGGDGLLSEEAAMGRIRALRRLGRMASERRAIEAFLGQYPRSVHVAELKRRSAKLSAP